MTDVWMGYACAAARRELRESLGSISPGSLLCLLGGPDELRDAFADEEPGSVGAIVGRSEQGVSDVNLAAAIAHDGRASEVVLVCRNPSGSLRSRAARAGISRVIDAAAPSSPVRAGDDRRNSARGHPMSSLERTGEEGSSADKTMALQRTTVPRVREALARAQQARTTRQGGAVVTFVSGRGGVGKTTVVSSCAARASSWGMRVALVDLDFTSGNLSSFFGAAHGSDLGKLAGSELTREAMGRANVRVAENVFLWGPCERPEEAEGLMAHVGTLIGYLRERFDLVLIDCPVTFTVAVAKAVQSTDRLVLVSPPGARAIASVARVSSLAIRLGVARTKLIRLENWSAAHREEGLALGRAELGLESARVFRVPDGGDDVDDLTAAGEVCALATEEGAFGNAIGLMLAHMLSELGKLPDCDAAREDAERCERPRRFLLFGRRKEA